MISLEKWMILAPLQKLRNNVGDLGKIILTTIFKWLPKVQKIAQSGHTASGQPCLLLKQQTEFSLNSAGFYWCTYSAISILKMSISKK